MLDHVSLEVGDYERSKTFYVEALGPLGYELLAEFEGNVAGLGVKGKPDFWIAGGSAAGAIHVAFVAPDRATVNGFHAAALAAGGKDNGQPGPRPHYHANYYGAFAFDLDGNKIEACSHHPE